MKALEVSGLKKSFGGVVAVDNISFSVEHGQILSIIGPNGAGKTTLFNLITGFYRPESGTIKLYGKDITGLPPYKIARIGISRTFQNLRLFSNMSVFENILSAILQRDGYNIFATIFRTRRYAVTESKAEEKARRLMDVFQLSDKADFLAHSLPYGEQRRLELARALCTQPKFVLIDEPGAGMNPREIQNLVKTIQEIKEKFSLTIIIIEHQMGLVMNISDCVMVMDFGEKIMEGTPDKVKRDERVIKAYLGEEFEWK